MQDAAPNFRVYCPWPGPSSSGTCRTYLGRRPEVLGDKSHQWKMCSDCGENTCMACETKQSDQNVHMRDCAAPAWFLDFCKQYYVENRSVVLNFT